MYYAGNEVAEPATWPSYTYSKPCIQHSLTCTRTASLLAPCCANVHSESVLCCWVKVVNHHTRVCGVDSVDSICHSPNLKWRRLISHKVHRKPSCLMEGECGPSDTGTSVADDSLHIHPAHLDSWRCTHEEHMQQGQYRGSNRIQHNCPRLAQEAPGRSRDT